MSDVQKLELSYHSDDAQTKLVWRESTCVKCARAGKAFAYIVFIVQMLTLFLLTCMIAVAGICHLRGATGSPVVELVVVTCSCTLQLHTIPVTIAHNSW